MIQKKYFTLLLSILLFIPIRPASAQSGLITIVSREDGSGTRQAFTQIMGVTDELGDDITTFEANIQNQTSGAMQVVANDRQAISYISLGSVDDSVKIIAVDGVMPTPETVNDGSYPIARPFLLTWGKELTDLQTDFLSFIHSKQGQTIVESAGFIAVSEKESMQSEDNSESIVNRLPDYKANSSLKGTIELVGSTSVTPVLEQLAEAYSELTGVKVNIQSTGSSAGIQAALEGTADFGMSSRALSEAEDEKLESSIIAQDTIAVIVNPDNPLTSLSLEDIRGIFIGGIEDWSQVTK
ncbi:phosphate ABC transporter substrate-binding protein [Falseniella ignava]|uniref:Phosphate ABC transporter substrate-binding protein n=1 Tax=Falseniella ignava TaxID=137730 RepID=A0A2I1K4N9_9LACT|nr:substrate-binding domain-containing protein [Falseniella ignava]PKY90522.1 phosphate ABC transporter substrate-binding protein [Falseniella ignava]